MAKTVTLETLLSRRENLASQLKKLDVAIRVARENDRQQRHQKILDALSQNGLIDTDPDALIAALKTIKLASAPGLDELALLSVE